MAGSGKRKTPKSLKNKAMLVVRNITKQEVTNVIFPNGVTVGLEGKFFSNGFKVNGDAQVSGTLNAGGLKVNGVPFAVGGSPFLFLDVDSNVFAFDNAADTAASPTSIVLSALQVSQSATLPESAFQVLGSDGTDLISSLGSHSVVETSTGNCIRTATLTYNDSTMRSKFPITTRVVHEGLTSTKKISKVEGGTDGSVGPAGTTPATLFLDLDTNVVSFDDPSSTTPSQSTVGITVTQTGQSSTISSIDLAAFDALGGSVTISSFSSTATSTGNSTATAQISAPTDQSKYPISIVVANEGLTSSKKVAKAVGGSSSIATTNVSFSVDLSSHSALATATNNNLSTRITMVKGNTSGHARGYSSIGLNFSGTSGTNYINVEAGQGVGVSSITGLSFDERELAMAIPNIANSSGAIKNVSGTVTLSDFRSGTANVLSTLGFMISGYISDADFSSANPTFESRILHAPTPADLTAVATSFPNFGSTKVVSFTATPNSTAGAIDQDEMLCFAIDLLNGTGNMGKGAGNGNDITQGIMDFNIQITYER